MKKHILAALLSLFAINGFAQQYNYSNPGQRVIEPTTEDASGVERFNIHFQATYIYQYKPAFNSPYNSPNSLIGKEEKQNSLTGTLYFGARLWSGAELYVNPELAGGRGLSGALGMGGSSNGETFLIGNPAPSLYIARAYFKQTFSIRNKHARKFGILNQQESEANLNQLAGYEPKEYIRLYAGKFSLTDLFDNNVYSNSPRTQFINWSLKNNGSWDYAANTRGYTYSFVAEAQISKMNFKAGIAVLPELAKGPKLNTDLSEAYAMNAEISRTININKRPGNIRLLGFYNTANMGNYQQSIKSAIGTLSPDITVTRVIGNTKYGFGLNFDQQLSNTFGMFTRIGWNDGKNETWCFTEIDQTLALGISANGSKWNRENDNCGAAIVVNGLSKDHRAYLAKGGSGFILGDGKLNYSNEVIGELYYSFRPLRQGIWFSGDYQYCMNPGYNADRGPVHIFSLRFHVEL